MSDDAVVLPGQARIDLVALAAGAGVDLPVAFDHLRRLYAEIDARIEANTQGLGLPCQSGCSACCYESVFLTPLEFFFAWDWFQQRADDQLLREVIGQGLSLYASNRVLIEQLSGPVPSGQADHLTIAVQVRFRCPFLSADETCRIYPARELYARLFGCSFNEDSGVYGCEQVGKALAEQTVTLLRARPVARLLDALPLTHLRQVYPFYFHSLYPNAGE